MVLNRRQFVKRTAVAEDAELERATKAGSDRASRRKRVGHVKEKESRRDKAL